MRNILIHSKYYSIRSLILITLTAFFSPTNLHADPLPLPEISAGAKLTEPLKIDGKLDESAWKSAAVLGPFIEHMGRQDQITAPTTARILWDDKTLYVGFDCTEPKPENILTKITGRDEGIFQDDCVEIFINARPNQRDYIYHHFAVSASGVLFDAKGTPKGVDKTWNGDWKASVFRTSTGWQVIVPIGKLISAERNLIHRNTPAGQRAMARSTR